MKKLLITCYIHAGNSQSLASSFDAGNCVNFVIDAVDEILILFENVIEIYGDIQGASNSFQLKAYEQGKRIEYIFNNNLST